MNIDFLNFQCVIVSYSIVTRHLSSKSRQASVLTMQTFTAVFLVALLLTFCVRMWLATRHIHHVLGPSRIACPIIFLPRSVLKRIRKRRTIPVPRLAWVMSAYRLKTVLLLILTLGGGLNVLVSFLVESVERSDCQRHGTHYQHHIADERSWRFPLATIEPSLSRTVRLQQNDTAHVLARSCLSEPCCGSSIWHSVVTGRTVANGEDGFELVVFCLACMDGVQSCSAGYLSRPGSHHYSINLLRLKMLHSGRVLSN